MDTEQVVASAEERMGKAVENTRHEFVKIRTGKATTGLLDGIKVEYYGSMMNLNQVANISVPEPRMITVQPWEKNMLQPIEKAILASDLGITPSNDGTTIRLAIPKLTEERRKELVKLVKKFSEEGKIAVRNIRRDANDQFKKAEKNHDISEDISHTEQDRIQKMTDTYSAKIDELFNMKEKEIMEV